MSDVNIATANVDVPQLMSDIPSDANNPDEFQRWSSEFQLAMFAINSVHAANTALVSTMQSIADRVANT